MIYMYALPLVAGSLWEGNSLDGRLVYWDSAEKCIPSSASTPTEANFTT